MQFYKTEYDAESRTWRGPSVNYVFNPEASLGQVLMELMIRSPERVVQQDMDTGRSMTYAEFRTALVRFAQNLATIGIRQGDVVTVACANSENLAPLVCALITIGAPVSPLAPSFHEDDMANMMQVTKPKLVFADANNYEVVQRALERSVDKGDQVPALYVFECTKDDVKHAEDLLKETGREANFVAPYLGDTQKTLAAIVCSSGTSGAHKGVGVTHAAFAQLLYWTPYDPVPVVNFNFSAIYWTSGFNSLLTPFFNGNIRLFTRQPFNEEQLFDAIEKHRVSILFTPPAYASTVLAHPRVNTIDFSSLRYWALGGSPVPEQMRDRIDSLLNPTGGRSVNVFGSSEVALIAIDVVVRKPNAVGTLMPNVAIRIVDESGQRLGVGEEGELLMSTPARFGGYYGNEGATAEATDADGFFRSGDIGYVDEDGFLYIIDRRKDIFKYRNYHVSPTDLETIILRIPGVQSVCVVGIPDQDTATDIPAAAIVRSPDATELTASQVRSLVDEQVSDFKRLRGGVYFVDELPKTLTGKILRRKVAEIVRGMRHDS